MRHFRNGRAISVEGRAQPRRLAHGSDDGRPLVDNSESVVVVATFVPVAGHEAKVEAALRKAVAATHRDDAGCELYAAHRSVRGKASFVIIEKWASASALQAHGAGSAFATLSAELDGLLTEPLGVTVMRPLPVGDEKLGAL
ncbi:putative quinol monooxygenase [Nocardia africana]